MNIPQPTIAGQTQYSYELNPTVMIGLTQADSAATFLGEVHHVSVFINSYNGDPRPTTITARTLTGRLASAAVPLDGFPTGPNDDPRLLDVFADLIADAEQRHAQARLEQDRAAIERNIEAARAAHPAYQTTPGHDHYHHERGCLVCADRTAYQGPPSRVPGEARGAYPGATLPLPGAISPLFPREFEDAAKATVDHDFADADTTRLELVPSDTEHRRAPLHRCQHGNLVHPCACDATLDHTSVICSGFAPTGA